MESSSDAVSAAISAVVSQPSLDFMPKRAAAMPSFQPLPGCVQTKAAPRAAAAVPPSKPPYLIQLPSLASPEQLKHQQKIEQRRATIAEERARARYRAEEKQIESEVRERYADMAVQQLAKEHQQMDRLRKQERHRD
eukprot:SAG31_NODE_4826_length_2924_cov_1.463009_2_plen_137_part_00